MGSAATIKRLQDSVKVIRTKTNLYVSQVGSDTNAGTSPSKPFKTIQKAFDFLNAYIIVESGSVTINLTEGIHVISSELKMNHPQGSKVTLQGAIPTDANATSVFQYTDTTGYAGVVGSINYRNLVYGLDGGSGPNEGERFSMGLAYDIYAGGTTFGSGLTLDNSQVGKYIMVAPYGSDGEIQFHYNQASLGNSASNGITANSTSPKRYSETESLTRRFFAFGPHKVISNSNDTGDHPIVENRIRNRNPYAGVGNYKTNRVHTQSIPNGSLSVFDAAESRSVPTRYFKTVIFVPNNTNGIRVKNSGLKLDNIVIETYDPLTTATRASRSSGIVAEEGSTIILGTGFIVRNFGVGLNIKNRSLLFQSNPSHLSYLSSSYCGIGVSVSDNSQAELFKYVTTGCWDDGFAVEGQSNGQFNQCISMGNGRDGFTALRNSNIIAVRCFSGYNWQNTAKLFSINTEAGVGFGARLNSNIECSSCLSFRNGYGYFADKNSSINVSSSDSQDNLNRGVSVSESSNAIIGPFYYSRADQHGQYVSDASFSRNYENTMELSGLDSPTGITGSAFTIAMNSSSNSFGLTLESYGNNGIEAIYGSNLVGYETRVVGSTGMEGDAINCIYDSLTRLSGSTLTGNPTNKTALLNGYIEINGVEV